jgi:2-dehydropantoate 2-reductase
MRIAVLGMGAVGGYFGGRFVEAGGEAIFLVRAAHPALATGRVELSIESPFGAWRGPVPVAAIDGERVRADVVVVATKAFDFAVALAAPALRACVLDGTRLVPLLNGMRHLDIMPRQAGAVPAGGLAHLMARRDGDRIIHGNEVHRFRFGPLAGGRDAVLEALGDAFGDARIDAAYSADIVGEMWAKFQMLAAFSAMCCLFRATVGDIVATDNGRALMLRALEDTAAVAAAEGHPPTPDHREETAALLTRPGSRFAASMLRDVAAGQPTEADHVLGDMVRRGRSHGLDLPVLECA